MTRYRLRFWDPDGSRYGIPTYPWGHAPAGWATRRQLRALGLRPGGQPIGAQIMWTRYGTTAVAYLYRIDRALPKRDATPAQWAAILRALVARCTCPTCGVAKPYTIPRRYGECLDCAGVAA